MIAQMFYTDQTDIEDIKALTEPLMKSNFTEHIFFTNYTFTNIETNLEVLHSLPKDWKLNTTEPYLIYKHYIQSQSQLKF